MDGIMAIGAQRDQIPFAGFPTVTPELLVMDLKLIAAAAVLAFPSVSSQNFETQCLIRSSI